LKYTNGQKLRVVLNTRDLNKAQQQLLLNEYTNLVIQNSKLKLKNLVKVSKLPAQDILDSKKACYEDKANGYRDWMNLIADGDRLVALYNTIKNYPDEEYYIHMDIDLLIRKPIDDLIAIVLDNDVVLRLRDKDRGAHISKIRLRNNKKDSLITIALVGINNTPRGVMFVKEWVDRITNTRFEDKRNIKWGQQAIYEVFSRHRYDNDWSFWNLQPKPYLDSRLHKDSCIWYFKKKSKDQAYNQALAEYRRMIK
jgi:hypothetical protein